VRTLERLFFILSFGWLWKKLFSPRDDSKDTMHRRHFWDREGIVDWCLRPQHAKRLRFHYRPSGQWPDVVQIYIDPDQIIFAYPWLDGEEAIPGSMLHRLHALYNDYTKRTHDDQITAL
jgi:hypothetical protein